MSHPLRVGSVLLGVLLGTTFGLMFMAEPSVIDYSKTLLLRYGFDSAIADWFWFPAAAGGAAGAILGLINGVIQDIRETRAARRESAFRATVQSIESGSYGLSAPDHVPCVGLKENAREFFPLSFSVRVRQERPAPNQEIRFTVADLEISQKYENRGEMEFRTHLQTVAYYESNELRFPGFSLAPQGLMLNLLTRVAGVEDLDFPAHPEFSRAYHLSANVPENARRLFGHGPLLDYLSHRPGLSIASHANGIIIYRNGDSFEGEALQGFIQEAAEILRLFEQAARRAALLPPAPKADARAIADKAEGLVGRFLRAELVTHADLDAFLRQPAPRYIPAAILKYPDRFVSALLVILGSVFVVVGAFFLFDNVRALLSEETNNPAGAFMGLLLMVVGGLAAYFLGRIRWRCKHLLRHGRVASGRIENIKALSYAIYDETVYKVTVTYPTEAGSVQGSCNILGQSVRRARALVRDKKPARILYDPAHPQRILLADALLNVSEELEP